MDHIRRRPNGRRFFENPWDYLERGHAALPHLGTNYTIPGYYGDSGVVLRVLEAVSFILLGSVFFFFFLKVSWIIHFVCSEF